MPQPRDPQARPQTVAANITGAGGVQVIVHGRRHPDGARTTLLPAVLDSFHRLCQIADLVLVEGVGSPAEVILRYADIANMGFAEATDIPVVLMGDIERGGVIAQIVGTQAVLADHLERCVDIDRLLALAETPGR